MHEKLEYFTADFSHSLGEKLDFRINSCYPHKSMMAADWGDLQVG